MLNLWPWTLLKPKAPVNKPPAHWFNAVTTALCTMGVRVSTDGTMGIDRPNTDGSDWMVVIPSSAVASTKRVVTGVTWDSENSKIVVTSEEVLISGVVADSEETDDVLAFKICPEDT